jgi:hypothetical protein
MGPNKRGDKAVRRKGIEEAAEESPDQFGGK